jgi:predicted enzyme related to lactoylglutathione lyase
MAYTYDGLIPNFSCWCSRSTKAMRNTSNGVESERRKRPKNMLGLRTTIYKVGDIQKATEWYSKAFKTNPYFNEPYYVGFNIQGYELGLQPEENPTLNKIESVVSYWGVENIQETFDRLIELGATENEKPYDVGGEIMTATVKDPFGNVIGLIYNPHFQLKD